MRTRRIRFLASWLLCIAATGSAHSQQQLVPDSPQLSAVARKAIESAWLSDDERSALRVRHGVWSEADLQSDQLRAEAMLGAWRNDDAIFDNDTLAPTLRAEAALRRGRYAAVFALTEGSDSRRAKLLRAWAFEQTGRYDEADVEVSAVLAGLDREITEDASELVDAVEGLSIRARVAGRPSRDYQQMMQLLGRARNDLDRLDWRVPLAEARLLLAKHNRAEAVPALHDTLTLNPRAAEAWFLLGTVAISTFDFDSATRAIAALNAIDENHVLAALLQAEAALVNDDSPLATETLDALLEREGDLRAALALRAAADACAYELDAARARLDALDARAKGTADGYFTVGRHLAQNRQYNDAASLLQEAIARRPNWAAPQIELGLLEMQTGRDDRARDALESVAKLDRFNQRAAFSLRLLEELAGFDSIETEHFVIRYQPGEDEVVARMMPEPLEAMHEEVSARFGFEPTQRTIIEVMPDHRFFSVRITGMPWIHTVAACTGPLIAIEVPREGAQQKHLGLFDWLDVLRHEYTHTITLAQTRNRIPHWLTEAASVSMEHKPRDLQTARRLATALQRGELFDLEAINWAFIRPKKATDRALAYAQGAWMVEFMNETFGPDRLVSLLSHYFEGRREEDAIRAVLGIERDEFFNSFLAWAKTDAKSWGFFAEPSLDDLRLRAMQEDPAQASVFADAQGDRLRAAVNRLVGRIGTPREQKIDNVTPPAWPPLQVPKSPIDDEQVNGWLALHPTHPDLLELRARRDIDRDELVGDETKSILRRYRSARPLDPWPDRVVVREWLASGDLTGADDQTIKALARLESLADKDPIFAWERARLHRARGELVVAMRSAKRMVRIDPWRAEFRELIAAIALESGDYSTARFHLEALVVLEPDRTIHVRRLEALGRLESSN